MMHVIGADDHVTAVWSIERQKLTKNAVNSMSAGRSRTDRRPPKRNHPLKIRQKPQNRSKLGWPKIFVGK
jgi:hypothetical protein